MARLPQVAPSLYTGAGVLDTNGTALKFRTEAQYVAEMTFQDITPANSANFGSAWTEVDSGSNVNVSDGILTMNGSSSWGANGMWLTDGLSIGTAGYVEAKFSVSASLTNNWLFSLRDTTGLDTALNRGCAYGNSLTISGVYSNTVSSRFNISTSTYYTIRIYWGPGSDGTARLKIRQTITGGAWTSEEEYFCSNITAALAATVYPGIQRHVNNSGNPVSVKEFAAYSGYATDSPYMYCEHDAGSGKVFNNLDFTDFAMPGDIPSTNLQFDYSFDDGTPSYSSKKTLAQLKAVGKISENHRYIRIRIYAVSDGSTQVYVAKPNSDTAIDGIFNEDQVITAGGGDWLETNLADNKIMEGVAWGPDGENTGTLAADPAPAAPVITAAVYGAGKVRVKICTAPDYTKTFTYYMDGNPIEDATEILDTVYDITDVSAESHTVKVLANGVTDNTFSNEVTLNAVLTPAEDDIWAAVKGVFAADTGIATIDTVVYNQAQAQPELADGETSLQLYPLIVDPNGTKPALVICGKLRAYRESDFDLAENDLMTISRKFRECVDTIETEETWLEVSWADDEDAAVGETEPDNGRTAANAGYAEMTYIFRVGQV